MRGEKIDVLGVDLGYDSVKILANGQQLLFPSLAEIEDEGVLSDTSFEVLKRQSNLVEKFDPAKMIVKIQSDLINGQDSEEFSAYRVGDYVLNQNSSSVGYSLAVDKYEQPEEFAKLLAGISLLFPKADMINIDHLVTGLPIKYYENHKDTFKNKLTETFKVKLKNINNNFVSKKINIKKTTIIPQGLASYYDFIMDEKGQVTANIEGGLGIVDLGGLTIDCVAFNKGELIKGSPISFSEGIRKRIFKKIQDYLDIDVSQDIIKKQILKGEDYIEVRGQIYDFKEVKEEEINKLARDIALQIQNRWESYLMIDKILITGGASILLFDSLEEHLAGFPCEQINLEPQFSNCRGYVKLGKALQRKVKAKLKEKLDQKRENAKDKKQVKKSKKEIADSKKEAASSNGD
ncbi:ParM/StbA family protein [Halanaerobacter jeridensis]|uniref:Plasmid segregation protein ParM n=1 Tax=Halanaerobacter jeridensis TaxID=706427 RepID=A0A938XU02_9FIRM|nr:ParM/StbA family protein [Halanaerobacter jeridensis]MBM7557500.1 plasmid segregation protein ParM [Halanaerobacter jeridensis]